MLHPGAPILDYAEHYRAEARRARRRRVLADFVFAFVCGGAGCAVGVVVARVFG